MKYAGLLLFGVAGLTVLLAGCTQAPEVPDASVLQLAEAPPSGVWVDELDLSAAPVRRPRRPRGDPGAQTPTEAPPPIRVALGGVEYPHGVPIASNRVNDDIEIDLKGQAARFMAMVGIDDGRGEGEGSAVFGIWVDGKKVADSGLMRGGEPPKLLSVGLEGAQRLVMATVDSGDGPGADDADWGGAVILMAPSATETPEVVVRPPEDPPEVASTRSATTQINYPRITGATPGRPFLFRIPASGEPPLDFVVEGLPRGLTLDSDTGIISGAMEDAGRFPVQVRVSGPGGAAAAEFTIVGGVDALALTPPLGWNSWNVWANAVDDEKTRAAADYMVSTGLAAQGYTYINIDDTWEGERDAGGVLRTNEKFPDMPALADYVHSLGLKLGIYSGPGPTTCQRFPASWQHEEIDVRTWADWGIDYLKYDWCGYSSVEPDRTSWSALQKPYLLMRRILDDADRDIVYSICQYGWGNVWEWGDEVGGNLWRTTGDITDTWTSMSGIGFAQAGHEVYAGPGHWNDPDMLVVGKVGWGPNIRDTRLSPNEQVVHISLWALQAAPLLIGADMAQLDEFTINLLGNREVLSVSQDPLGRAAGRVHAEAWFEVWARPLADGSVAVGLFNRAPVDSEVEVSLEQLGLSGTLPARDLWRQADMGTATGTLSAMVPRHGVVLVKIG